MGATLLLVDDEQHILELAKLYLEKEGFRVEVAKTGAQALAQFEAVKPVLVVLDLMLPELDGFEVCRRLRHVSDVPILMLTARSEDVDKIVGLEIGADDYLTKPFNPRELAARVKAIIRRYEAGQKRSSTISMGSLQVDLERREALLSGQPVPLRTKEFDLLVALLQHAGIVLSRERLLEMVWGYDFCGETRTVDVHVNHLREKLGDGGLAIQAIRGIGYKLVIEG